MRNLVALALAGCWSSSPPSTSSVAPAHAPVRTALPCGLTAAAQFERVPLSEAWMGTCRVEERGDHRDIFDGDRLVLVGGEAKATIAHDARIPGPHGLRVGMTGRQITARLPRHRWHHCFTDDAITYCELRASSRPTPCEAAGGSDEADPILIGFPARPALDDADGTAISDTVATLAAERVVLVRPC